MHEINICNVIEYQILLKINILQEKRLPTDKYGFFVGKNESYDGMVTMVTGKSDIRHIGEILAFDGKQRLNVWNGEYCNKIRLVCT